MKNTIKLIAGIMILGLTSCGTTQDLYENRTPTILPNDLGESTPQSDDYQVPNSESEMVSNETVGTIDSDDSQEQTNQECTAYDEVEAEEEECEPIQYESTCQDMIYLTDGRVFPITYLKETSMGVKFKKCDDPINRTWRKDKVKIQKIEMADGTVKEYNMPQTGTDGTAYYQPKQSSNDGAKIAGVVGVGLVGAIVVGTLGFLFLLSVL